MRRSCAPVLAVLLCLLSRTAWSQEPPVRGLYNWVHSTADAERAFAFYRDVLGLELAPSPFIPNATAPEGIRPWSAVTPDEIIWNLTDTKGSRARTVFMRAPNTPFGLELSEFIEIPRNERAANPWDPGASRLIFTVRNFNAVVVKLRSRNAPVVTLGGGPVSARGARRCSCATLTVISSSFVKLRGRKQRTPRLARS